MLELPDPKGKSRIRALWILLGREARRRGEEQFFRTRPVGMLEQERMCYASSFAQRGSKADAVAGVPVCAGEVAVLQRELQAKAGQLDFLYISFSNDADVGGIFDLF